MPIFFVLMGARVDLSSFTVPGVPAFAARAHGRAAVAGKQVCSLGVLERGVDKLAVGLGMIPRGEVGLIFANIGLALTLAGEPVIDRRRVLGGRRHGVAHDADDAAAPDLAAAAALA